MGAPEIRVVGLRAVIASMQKMGVEVDDLRDTFHGLGLLVADEAKDLAPKDSGALAESIRPSRRRKNSAAVLAGSARVPYAGVIHYGCGSRSGPGPHNITGNPFLTTAAVRKRPQVIREIEQGLDSLIQRLDLR